MSARHHHSPEIDAYWGRDYDEQGKLAQQAQDARLACIDRRIAAGYLANNSNVHGRFMEYVDTTTLLADVRYLMAVVREERAA